jgi:hypothetical protein
MTLNIYLNFQWLNLYWISDSSLIVFSEARKKCVVEGCSPGFCKVPIEPNRQRQQDDENFSKQNFESSFELGGDIRTHVGLRSDVVKVFTHGRLVAFNDFICNHHVSNASFVRNRNWQ